MFISIQAAFSKCITGKWDACTEFFIDDLISLILTKTSQWILSNSCASYRVISPALCTLPGIWCHCPPSDTQSSAHRSESQGSRLFGGKSLWRVPSVIGTAAKWACSLLGANRMDGATSSWLHGAELKRCTARLFDNLPSPSAPLYGYHQSNIEYSKLISSTATVTAIFNYWIIICTHQHNRDAWSSAYINHQKLVWDESPWWFILFTYFSESPGLFLLQSPTS